MNLLELFKPIRSFIFDIEGVLTDGTLLISEIGTHMFRLHSRDLYALQQAQAAGYELVFISEHDSRPAAKYLREAGFAHVHTHIRDKAALLGSLKINTTTTIYMGDDMPDLAAMQLCAIASCPNDAVSEIREKAAYISPRNSGHGCIRDVIEKVLKLNNCW